MFSGEFAAGRHFVTLSLGQGAAMQRIRVERKKDAVADYIATVRRLGLDLGASGPITREKAVEAMRFLKGRRGLDPLNLCQDILEREPCSWPPSGARVSRSPRRGRAGRDRADRDPILPPAAGPPRAAGPAPAGDPEPDGSEPVAYSSTTTR